MGMEMNRGRISIGGRRDCKNGSCWWSVGVVRVVVVVVVVMGDMFLFCLFVVVVGLSSCWDWIDE
jgi:hypothetical protein